MDFKLEDKKRLIKSADDCLNELIHLLERVKKNMRSKKEEKSTKNLLIAFQMINAVNGAIDELQLNLKSKTNL